MRTNGLIGYLGRTFHYRELIRHMVVADRKRKQNNTLLGFLWSFLNPLLSMAVYLFIFKVIFKSKIEDYALYLFWGLLPFRATQMAISDSASSIVSKGRLINSVAFPRIILPVTQVLSSGYQFTLTLLVLIPISFLLGGELSLSLLLLPIIVLLQLVLTMGLALLAATANAYFRDVENLLPHLMRMWFYLSPGVYDMDQVPQSLRRLYLLNPFRVIMPAYREVMMYGRVPDFSQWLWPTAAAVFVLVAGLLVFYHRESIFPKLV